MVTKDSDAPSMFWDYQPYIMGIRPQKYALNFKFPIITH